MSNETNVWGSHESMQEEFRPPKDEALHALWVIRNWTKLPKGNLMSYEDIVKKVNLLASEVFDKLHK